MATTRSTVLSNAGNSVTPRSSSTFLTVMQAIHDEISRDAFLLFIQRGSTGGGALDDWLQAESMLLRPVAVSIEDDKDHLTVTADVPGFSPEELKIKVEGRNFHICGKSEEHAKPDMGPSSAGARRICCNVRLPVEVDPDELVGTLDHGVLTLKIPKPGTQRQIETEVAA